MVTIVENLTSDNEKRKKYAQMRCPETCALSSKQRGLHRVHGVLIKDAQGVLE